jgi:hypothetical protein
LTLCQSYTYPRRINGDLDHAYTRFRFRGLDSLLSGGAALNHHSEEFAKQRYEIRADVRSKCRGGWSDAYGGCWVQWDYEDVSMAAHRDVTFPQTTI